MAEFHLVRHGLSDAAEGVLPGRHPGVLLSAEGRRSVEALLPRLKQAPIAFIYASPLERTRQTAQILAADLHLEVIPTAELLELDYGDWTNSRFAELASNDSWGPYNAFRSGTRIPGGELMLETQCRAIGFMLHLRDQNSDQTTVLVTHGDVIRSVLTYFLGMPLDFYMRVQVETASLSTIRLDRTSAEVLCVNWKPH